MPVINVAYEINQTVFYVDIQNGIRESVVRSSAVSITPTATNITYNLAYKLPLATGSSATANQDDIFPTIDSAMVEYQNRIEC
jgi:hypothetical protein